MLSGDNGILQKATDAKIKNDETQIRERVRLAYNAALSKDLTSKNGKLTLTTLKNEINYEFGTDGNVIEDGDYWVILVKENEIERINKTPTKKIKFYLDSPNSNVISNTEIEIEEGTTWLEWANDLSKETGNEKIDFLRAYLREKGANKYLAGYYDTENGFYGISLFDDLSFIDHPELELTTNNVIEAETTYKYDLYEYSDYKILKAYDSNQNKMVSVKTTSEERTTFEVWIRNDRPDNWSIDEENSNVLYCNVPIYTEYELGGISTLTKDYMIGELIYNGTNWKISNYWIDVSWDEQRNAISLSLMRVKDGQQVSITDLDTISYYTSDSNSWSTDNIVLLEDGRALIEGIERYTTTTIQLNINNALESILGEYSEEKNNPNPLR